MRETTLESEARQHGLRRRRCAIRDVCNKDIEEIQIEAEYQTAKKIHAPDDAEPRKRVQQYRDDAIPLYRRFQIEQQLDAMHNPEVHLKSGSYIVINQTEALVAIDVNSNGKSTRERNIEKPP